MAVQIFGVRNSNATRAAERFFKERRAEVHFVDLAKKPMSPGEIRRFVDRFGLAGLVDTESNAYTGAGLQYLRVAETDMLARIEREPRLLRLPLVRSGNRVSIGQDEVAWKAMLNTTS
jgi:arsenate reductase-like glutaredoxin family protein